MKREKCPTTYLELFHKHSLESSSSSRALFSWMLGRVEIDNCPGVVTASIFFHCSRRSSFERLRLQSSSSALSYSNSNMSRCCCCNVDLVSSKRSQCWMYSASQAVHSSRSSVPLDQDRCEVLSASVQISRLALPENTYRWRKCFRCMIVEEKLWKCHFGFWHLILEKSRLGTNFNLSKTLIVRDIPGSKSRKWKIGDSIKISIMVWKI